MKLTVPSPAVGVNVRCAGSLGTSRLALATPHRNSKLNIIYRMCDFGFISSYGCRQMETVPSLAVVASSLTGVRVVLSFLNPL